MLTIAGTPEPDGRPVWLDVSVLSADPAQARPAVVLAHGFGGTKDDLAETARTLAQDGFAVITFTARGFGASGGLIHLNHPDYEGADAQRVLDLAAQRPEVLKAGGDPVVGFAGASYGGALALLVAGLDPRVDAIVPGLHLEPAGPGPVPAVPGRRRGPVPGRRDAGRRQRGVQAGLGLPPVQQRRSRAGRRGGGRRPGLRTVHRGAVRRLPPGGGDRTGGPAIWSTCWPSRVRTECWPTSPRRR